MVRRVPLPSMGNGAAAISSQRETVSAVVLLSRVVDRAEWIMKRVSFDVMMGQLGRIRWFALLTNGPRSISLSLPVRPLVVYAWFESSVCWRRCVKCSCPSMNAVIRERAQACAGFEWAGCKRGADASAETGNEGHEALKCRVPGDRWSSFAIRD